MDPIVRFLKDDTLPEEKSEVEKIRRKALWFWLSEDRKLYKHSYFGPYLLFIHLKASELLLEELHKEFVLVTQEEDLYITKPSPKDIGDWVCRRKPRSMSRSAINAKDSLQTSTNQEESSTLSLVLGHLLSGAWIL